MQNVASRSHQIFFSFGRRSRVLKTSLQALAPLRLVRVHPCQTTTSSGLLHLWSSTLIYEHSCYLHCNLCSASHLHLYLYLTRMPRCRTCNLIFSQHVITNKYLRFSSLNTGELDQRRALRHRLSSSLNKWPLSAFSVLENRKVSLAKPS